MAGKKLKQAIDFTCEIAQGNLVNRGVDYVFNYLSGKVNSDFDTEDLKRNFKSLMARVVDTEKDISIKVQRQGGKRKREVEVWLEDVKNVEDEFHAFEKEEKGKGVMKQIFGEDDALMKLNARIRDLVDQSRHFGELVVSDGTTSGLPHPTSELEGAAFQDNFQRIWRLLENDKVLSIGVHGMGGVGKSTLVDHIYNQLLEKNKCVFWVVVSSQRCSIKMLQNKIARKVGLDLSEDDDDEGTRAGRLNHTLSQRKNCVLILDDVWERIDLVKVGVPLSMEGCKWMMTSRSLNVCREMNCQEKIGVKPLLKDEGWNLFLKNLGQDATLALRDPEVEGIGKRMVEVCDGLPLGIITLAGAVSGVTEIQEWRHGLRLLEESAMGHEWMEEKVFSVLKYSFDRLNPNDQRCFLYCSLYPEDWKIPRKELLSNLISEKLVDEKKSRAAQRDEGHSVLTRLVKVSLLESAHDPVEGECVKMHDLVRGMAHKITKAKTMVIAGDESREEIPTEEEWTKDLEKVSLMMNEIEEIPRGISPNCPKLSTLLLRWNPLREGIASSFFLEMCGLRTLDLSYTRIQVLPDSVSDLVNLTSLLLGRCWKLVHVPCVRKLKELRELDLSMTSIKDVPQGMEDLLNIRFLSMDGNRKLRRMNLQLNSPRLQHLHLPLHIKAKLVQGGEKLEVFKGRLEHVTDFNRLVASKQDGISYSIVVGNPGDRFDDDFEYHNDGTRELYVCGYHLKENESMAILGDYIKHLEFNSCEGMNKCLLDDLTNPASLEKLTISHCGGVEGLLTYDQLHLKLRFQSLEQITLCQLDDFMGVIHKLEMQDAPLYPSIFSSLRRLTISRCNKIRKLGLPLSVFEKLEHISICFCEEIEEIIQVGAGEGDDISIPDLKVVELIGLPSLESFCDTVLICNLLIRFELVECPRLEVPFLNWGTPGSYKPLFPGFNVEQIRRQNL